MIFSMTGYGKAEGTVGNKNYRVEIRSLNSKGLEIRCKIPEDLREKELEIRNLLKGELLRGKIDLTLSFDSTRGEEEYVLDIDLLRHYAADLKKLSEQLGLNGDVLQAVMRIPNIVKPNETSLTEVEWKELKKIIQVAVEANKAYRQTEGKAMGSALLTNTKNIVDRIDTVVDFDTNRLEAIRTRFQKNFNSIAKDVTADQNRMEQEIIFYLEKLDFTEEIVRLRQHCKYLQEVMSTPQESKGKKINFITQEIGREINTLGAKAYDPDIQKVVVEMKDELEKIKEQTANIL
nr:YicC family protein [Saprospiraceae bacterium]